MAEKFDGRGFSKEDFSPDERRQFRHMFQILNADFVSLTKSQVEIFDDFASLIQGLQILGKVLKWALWILPTMAALGYYLSELGVFQ